MKIWIIKDISDMWYEARLHVLSFVLDLKESINLSGQEISVPHGHILAVASS
jgi:hypothetical protein